MVQPWPQTRRQAGFTLLEMLVVLAILALLGTLVLTRGPGRSAALETRLAANAILQTLRLARARAMANNAAESVVFDGPALVLRAPDGFVHKLPAGLQIALKTTADPVSGPRGAIVFLPDGSSNGGQIELTGNGQRSTISVNWLTGAASLLAGTR